MKRYNARVARWFGVVVVIALGVIGAGWLGAGRAEADIAPDPFAGGSDGRGAGPTQLTSVQMVSETVLIDVFEFSDTSYGFERQAVIAEVTADFRFNNPTGETEALSVGFPLYLTQDPPDSPRPNYPEIFGLQAYQDNVLVATRTADIDGEPWQVWDMTFPPGDTSARVTYQMPIVPEGALTARISYILATGAGWAGPIGQADLIVRFQYLAEENFVDTRFTLPGYTTDGYDLRWHFEALEPTSTDDLRVLVVNPIVWQDVLAARRAIIDTPTSTSYMNMALVYSDLIGSYRADRPTDVYSFYSPLMAQVAQAQYLRAIELDPNDRELRQAYRDFVFAQAGVMLPAESLLSLTQVAQTPMASLTPWPVRTFTPVPVLPTATSNPATPTAATLTDNSPRPTQRPTVTGPVPQPTQVAAVTQAIAPAATLVPTPAGSSSGSLAPWLLGAFVVALLAGLAIALRRPKAPST